MKKTILLIFIFNSLSFYSSAQWIVQNLSSLTTAPFNTVYFTDSLHGWIGGTNDTIIHTTDGGINWSIQNVSANITGIFFIDSLNGWAVTNNGQVLHSYNSGSNWSYQNLSGDFKFVHFYDTSYGMIAGKNGLIYKTLDGGQNWSSIAGTVPITFNDVYILDSLHAWGVGYSKVYKYNGTSWTLVSTGTDFYSVFFLDSLNGWAAGSYETIKKTNDGGLTWTLQHQSTNWPYLGSLFFIDSLNGWAAGDLGEVFRYDGSNWQLENTNFNLMLSSIYFPDINHGWAVSWAGNIIHTDMTNSIFEVKSQDQSNFILFPNPITNKINFNVVINGKLIIINSYGKVVYENILSYNLKGISELDISFLQAGLYFIKVGNEVSKFIKE
jgi:photosystem II stability/assembly factor-like uncharacterized protein